MNSNRESLSRTNKDTLNSTDIDHGKTKGITSNLFQYLINLHS